MGRYEEVKVRRHSAPVPGPRGHQEDGGRKWSGGLMPLSSAGCYAQLPATSRRPSSASLASSQGNIRPKKVKTYAAYSVSKSVGKILTFVLILFNLQRLRCPRARPGEVRGEQEGECVVPELREEIVIIILGVQ